jgi:predicted DNA-binding protein (MmcQ/YjbR family)
MTFAGFYDFCVELDEAEPSFPFDKNTLAFKRRNKIFALTDSLDFRFINLKCEPEKAIELRERYQGIQPGFHMNKKHWNSVHLNQDVPDEIIYELINHSFALVKA